MFKEVFSRCSRANWTNIWVMKSIALKAATAVTPAMARVQKGKSDTLGDVVLTIPCDRNSSFEPQLIPKHQRMSSRIEETIVGMYSRGMSTRDIEEQIRELYGVEVSESTVSTVTNRIADHIKEWQARTIGAGLFCLPDGWYPI